MKNRIGSKLLACLLVFVLIFTGAPFGAFATELDSDAVADMEQISECGDDTPEISAADSTESHSAQQNENEDPEDTSVPSASSTDVPATSESADETGEEPSTQESADDNGSSSDVNNDVTNEPTVSQSTDEMAGSDNPSAVSITENENSDDANVNDAGDDTANASETTDTSAEENGDAEAEEGASGTDDIGKEENTESDESYEVADETADDNMKTEPSFTAEIRIVVNEGHPVYMGETASLKVEVTDANYEYSIRWETHDPASDIEGEEPVWNTVGIGREYSFLATQAAVSLEYRVVVYAEQGKTSRVVRITALERTEDTSTETEPETDINADLSEDSAVGDDTSVVDATDETVNDQEGISTDGDTSIDGDYEDNSSDIADPTEENKTDENAAGDDVVDNTDAENAPVDINVDEGDTETVDESSGSDADLPNDVNAENEEDAEDVNECEVIDGDGNEANEETNVDDDADGNVNAPDDENTEDDTEPETSEGNEDSEDENIENRESAEENEDTEVNETPELEVISESVIITQTYIPESGKSDNDELFAGYVNNLFSSIGTKKRLRSAYSVGSSLIGNNAIIYSELKNMVTAVANGNENSTIYSSYDFGEVGHWTVDELGIEELLVQDATTGEYHFSQEAQDAATEKAMDEISLDLGVVIDALLADCPYELYWYDKTDTGGTSATYRVRFWGNQTYIYCSVIYYTVYMTVASEFRYAGDEYTVDATKANAAKDAVSNIQSILAITSEMTPREKLDLFKSRICEMVSYNSGAAGNSATPYGYPWQLVWVFDGDSTTNVVCEGYSKAFKYLCDQVDISCLLVTGMMGGGTGAGPHMWNLVKLDGYTYLVDVTNSDTGTVGSSGQLFMVMLEPGNEWDNYTISGVNYQYDDDTKAAYSLDTLSVSVNGAVIDENAPTFSGHSILLTGQIGLQFFLKLPDGKTASDYPGSYVTFAGNKINSETHRSLPTSTAMINGIDTGKYLFTVNLSSVQMADKLIPAFHYTENGEEKTIVGDAYSAKDYISWALGIGVSSLTAQQKRIVSGLADYGHYAQPYLSRQNGWEIGADYAEMTSFQTKEYDYDGVMSATSNSVFNRTQETNDVTSVNYRLIFGSQISLQVRIAPANSDVVLPIEAPGGSISQTDGYYMVTYPGVYANQLTVTRTITAGDCTITVSPMSYVYDMLRSETEQDDAKNLVCALFGYAQACK